MKLFSKKDVECYLANDNILYYLEAVNKTKIYTSHQWLLDSVAKRMIYSEVYKELLLQDETLKVLDVAGGYTNLIESHFLNHEYEVLDIMAHDNHSELKQEEDRIGKKFWINNDWLNFEITRSYDLIIANDMFPNVDQRLDLFIEKFLPHCKTLRLTTTYYDIPRYYKVKRTDADEILFMLAWGPEQLMLVLNKYKDKIIDFKPNIIGFQQESLFPNKRQIAFIEISGEG